LMIRWELKSTHTDAERWRFGGVSISANNELRRLFLGAR
jgi:hypothetical protein